MAEHIAYWAFGVILAAAVAVGVGRGLVAEHGKKAIPVVVVSALVLAAVLGWAISAYIDYARASATMHF
ncbi:MAG: hypothetical protein WCB99_04515 [Candidatus Cybelea sp.]